MGTNNGNQKEFNFNPPNPIYSQNCANGCNSPEGNSTMDDGNGQVILQSTGTDVYDGNWNVLPSGNAIGRGAGASNGSLILQHLSNPNLYYVFSVDAGTNINDDTLAVGLQYAVVDITLNGGTGGVISKHNILTDSIYEKMSCTRHCNGIDWWLVVQKWGTNAYYSYRITTAGVDTIPVISHAGMILSDTLNGYSFSYTFRAGSMRISPDGKYLGITNGGQIDGDGRGFQLFLYNNQTGVVGPRLFLDSVGNGSRDSFCFSPNSKKLYRPDIGDLGSAWGKNLVVYNLNLPDSNNIAASEMGFLSDTNSVSFLNGIQLGLDGKIYLCTAGLSEYYITIIDNPDADSADLVIHLNQIPIVYSTFHNFTQFPDCIFARKHQGILRTRKCSYGLENETIILDTMLNVVHEFTWDFGDPASGINNSSTERNPYHEFTTPGAYIITLTLHNACNQFTVTQQFVYNYVTVEAGSDITVCQGDTAFLNVSATGGANNFIWQPSNLVSDSTISNPYAFPTSNNYFIATQQPSGCLDTVLVNINNVTTPIISQVGINLGATAAISYQWYVNGTAILGATLQEHFPSQIGNYTVVTTDANGCTAGSTPFNITVVGINSLQSNNTFIYPNPAQDELFISSPSKFMSYVIYDLLGSKMQSNIFNSKIDIKSLPQGVYIIALQGGNELVQKMWVKE
jgi:hypothetical protein